MKSFVLAALLGVSSAEIITVDNADYQAATPEEALFFSEDLNLDGAEPTTPCCHSCTKPLEKYHSVDHVKNKCAETCISPWKYWIEKLFEHGLQKSTTNTPCADREYTKYENTPTHGFGPFKMSLDQYAKRDAAMIGYYSWGWGAGSAGPPGATVGVAFTGLVNVTQAVDQYTPGCAWCCPKLVGPGGKGFISIGGGNAAGLFSKKTLAAIAQDMDYIVQSGQYIGILFDVEVCEGPSAGLIAGFDAAIDAAKKAGLIVGITSSHSAPYQTDTPQIAIDIVKSWVSNPQIDFLSPQLYSSGKEAAPELAETAQCAALGCKWELYKGSSAKLIPSIVAPSHYAASQKFFASKYGIQTDGYIQWAQTKRSSESEQNNLFIN